MIKAVSEISEEIQSFKKVMLGYLDSHMKKIKMDSSAYHIPV